MKKYYLIAGLVVVAAAIIVYVALANRSSAPVALQQDAASMAAATSNSPSAPASSPLAPSAPASAATIIYTDSGFSPATLTVAKGTAVAFKNEASDAFWPASNQHPIHSGYDGTTLQEHCANPTATTFDACSSIQPGGSWSFVFGKSGTWGYHNHLNPSEGGTVIVK